MSAELCTSDQAIAALGYLRHAFGGYGLQPTEERLYLRAFRNFTATQVRQAIDDLVLVAGRRPSPADICAQIQKTKPKAEKPQGPFLDQIPATELTPPEAVPERVADLRRLAVGE